MLETVRGIVASEYVCADNLKYIHILTFGRGKLSVAVKRYNRGIYRYSIPARVFCIAEFVIYTSQSGSHSFNEATGIANYFDSCSDYDVLLLGSYFLSVAEYMMVEEQPDDEMLAFLLNSLWLITHDNRLDLRIVKAVFELKMIQLFGAAPDLSACRECGKQYGNRFFLSADDGCLICDDCVFSHNRARMSGEDAVLGEEVLIPLSQPTLDAMRYVLGAEQKRIYKFSLIEKYVTEFRDACRKYFECRVDHKFPVEDMFDLKKPSDDGEQV